MTKKPTTTATATATPKVVTAGAVTTTVTPQKLVEYKDNLKPTTTIKYEERIIPKVKITQVAMDKMRLFVDEVNDEVGWLGTTERDEETNTITIKDVFMFKQQVHGTTTEITTEGLSEFAEELMQLEDGIEIWNDLRLWGHSHVRMGITPSGQDNQQMNEFRQNGQPYFLRLIANKLGAMAIDVYDYEKGLQFHNVPFETILIPETEEVETILSKLEEAYTLVDALEKQLEDKKEAEVNQLRPAIKQEIQEKVSKLVVPTYTGAYAGTYGHGRGVNTPSYQKPQTKTQGQAQEPKSWGTSVPKEGTQKVDWSLVPAYYLPKNPIDMIQVAEDLDMFFDPGDISRYSTAVSFISFLSMLSQDRQLDLLSKEDTEFVWRVVQKIREYRQSSAQ